MRQAKFRQDLYHRVYVFPLLLPPLRERQEDIPPLVDHFAAQVAAQNGWKPPTFLSEAIDERKRYSRRGNVRVAKRNASRWESTCGRCGGQSNCRAVSDGIDTEKCK